MSESFENQESKINTVPVYDPNDQLDESALQKFDPQQIENTQYSDPILEVVANERKEAFKRLDPEWAGLHMKVGGHGLDWALRHIDFEVGMCFKGHGFSKQDPVQSLDHLLTQGIDKEHHLYNAAFVYTPEAAAANGASNPLTNGGIIVVGGYKEHLMEGGIKYVVLGEEYNRVVDLLQKKYPQVTFVPWNKAVEFFTAIYNEHNPDNPKQAQELTKENTPTYARAEEPVSDPMANVDPHPELWIQTSDSTTEQRPDQENNEDSNWI